ncbi:Lrp/AsnC family transcriptional regulator, partial [Chloroflexota bacterium]
MKIERVSHSIKINLDELRKAKSAAATERKTLGQWLEEAIEEKLISETNNKEVSVQESLRDDMQEMQSLNQLHLKEQKLQDKEANADYDRQKAGIDLIDRSIIKELQRNARQSDARIARKLSLSDVTVRKKINLLIEADVIKITAVTTPWKVGYDFDARIGIRINLLDIDRIWKKLKSFSCVRAVVITIGRYDILIAAIFRTSEEMIRFVHKNLSAIPGIISTEIHITLKIRKATHNYLSDIN